MAKVTITPDADPALEVMVRVGAAGRRDGERLLPGPPPRQRADPPAGDRGAPEPATSVTVK